MSSRCSAVEAEGGTLKCAAFHSLISEQRRLESNFIIAASKKNPTNVPLSEVITLIVRELHVCVKLNVADNKELRNMMLEAYQGHLLKE